MIFTDAGVRQVMESVLLQSIAVSAVSAFAAFEIARMFGWNLYAGQQRRIAWTSLLAVGALASLINFVGAVRWSSPA